MNYFNSILLMISIVSTLVGCQSRTMNNQFSGEKGEVKLMVLDPGHFHADLILKQENERINRDVFVFAPKGVGLNQHLERVKSFNSRDENPTQWNLLVYDETDFLEKMLGNPPGNVVILAGNNQNKPRYIYESVASGLHVLADKPLAINAESFEKLLRSVEKASENQVMIYDMMTERFAVLNLLQRMIIGDKSLFGTLQNGTPDNPAVKLESTHHFFKEVAGRSLIRPAWYYDVRQQGEGLVDVTTHMIDIVHWKCFPEVVLDYKKDVSVLGASHWPTIISPEQFVKSTQQEAFPEYLQDVVKGNNLEVYSNGEILYQVKDIYVNLHVRWDYEAPAGTGDTHTSVIRGTRAVVEVVQDASTGFVPELYICPVDAPDNGFNDALAVLIFNLQKSYPDISISEQQGKVHVVVPRIYREAHETHFAKVAETFFEYLKAGKMPEWEIPNLIAKYYITTTAFEMANAKKIN